MAIVVQQSTQQWAICPSFARIGTWENRSRRREAEFKIDLTIGKPIARPQTTQLKTEHILEVTTCQFKLDTGCHRTLICGSLAVWFGFRDEGRVINMLTAGNGILPVIQGTIPIRLGNAWVEIPCATRSPIDQNDSVSSLLGMMGFLDAHLFCFNRDEVHLFRSSSVAP